MSREKVFYLFGLWQEVGRLSGYYRVSNQAQWLKNWFYYYYSRPFDEIPSDIADVLVNLESTFDLCKHSKTPDDVLPIKNVCQLYLENESSHFYEDIIVLKNQCFYGIVTIKDLLKYLIK